MLSNKLLAPQMKSPRILSVVLFLILCSCGHADAQGLTASEARAHIGEKTTVCGKVASATYATRSRGKPTFLNLDKPFPNHIFTAVIFDDYRGRFSYAPEMLKGRHICVTGLIETHKGKPQIKVRDPSQIDLSR